MVAAHPELLDQFEWDATSMQRIATSFEYAQYAISIYVFMHICNDLYTTFTHIHMLVLDRQPYMHRTDLPGGIVWWNDYEASKRRGNCVVAMHK